MGEKSTPSRRDNRSSTPFGHIHPQYPPEEIPVPSAFVPSAHTPPASGDSGDASDEG